LWISAPLIRGADIHNPGGRSTRGAGLLLGGSRRSGWPVEYRAWHERVWPDRGFKRVGEIFHVD